MSNMGHLEGVYSTCLTCITMISDRIALLEGGREFLRSHGVPHRIRLQNKNGLCVSYMCHFKLMNGLKEIQRPG